jgi:hypothetical protein
MCAAFSVREFAATVHYSRGRSTKLYPSRLSALYEAGSAGAEIP